MKRRKHLKKLPARQEPVLDSSKYTAPDQKLRVCDICGAFLSVYDSDRRLADHFGGKLHLGYIQIREKLAELQEERDKKRKAYEEERRSRDRDRRHHRDRERERDGYRSRSYDSRSHPRSRSRSRERSRDYDRYSRCHDRY
ncbi:putative RNA-binding protein Luc7-like 2 [Sesamum alatum]|uniref:RNA-binding protein Luc7-like 2 n=1 Tax=Sesamum alatum TaxID=300844 RepID=A0AAE2CNE2_9LAMI|nr:putative RNA-binding protein Luc7-like 2 [Sesamum alatum]